MKKLTIALLVSSLTACVPVDDEISSEARDLSMEQIHKDDDAVSSFLAQAKANDSSIVDAYISIDDSGTKNLNVVRQPSDSDDDSMEAMAFALGGAAMGAMAGSMLTQSYMSNRNSAPTMPISRDSLKRKKDEERSGYSSAVFSAAQNRAVKNSAIRNRSSSSSSSKPAFRSSSSARSSSYGSSGG
ncbi:hypothetical protein [Shewanella glacialipiscicola]|uniref:hypothetical protein n=1 Tax=Shewanella glacialipiscicola TaxID=614069 RepID=UPI003D7AB498